MKTEAQNILNKFVESLEASYISSNVSGFDNLQAGRKVAITYLQLENSKLGNLLELSNNSFITKNLNKEINKNKELISELNNMNFEVI